MSVNEMDIFGFMYEKYKLPETVKLFEAFSGIGCQRMAFDRLGIKYEMVGFSEIDGYAIQAYNAIHGNTKNYGSICDINGADLPEIDVFTYSFPCTDLSKAGKQKGLGDTRSGLVYEVLRILQQLNDLNRLPKVLIMENVVDLVQTKFIRQFQEIQLELEELGYSNYTETLNAKDFGVAQNRDRVFMVSILGEYSYEFPKPFKLEKRLKDYLEYQVAEKYYLSSKSLEGLKNAIERYGGDIKKMLDNEKDLNVIQYPRGENKGGLISDIISPTVDGAIGARNTAILCVREKDYGAVDEKYYLSDKAIKGMFNTDYNSAKAETRIQDQDSYCSTLMARDYKDAKCVVVEPKRLGGLYDDENGRHQAGSIWDKDAISPTIDTMQGGHRQPFIVEDKKDMLKTTLCNQLIANGEVKEYDVIKHSYTSQILDGKKKGVEKQDEMITLTTRPDCLGVVVKEKSLNESMIDENGNVKRYLNSDIVDEFGVGDCADISFPNGYNKGNRVYKGYAPAINLTTTKDNFVVKEPTLRIRKLTPLECWRLMDIDDELFYKAQASGISNAQLYKMAGNGIVVAVFAAIIDKLR